MAEKAVNTFLLADIGEGLTEVLVIELLVAPGDRITRLDPVIVVETDKSVVSLTSPWTGTVRQFHVAADEWVDVGAPLMDIEVEGG